MSLRKGPLGRAALLVVGVLLVVGFAHSPLLRAGLVASDHRALEESERPLTIYGVTPGSAAPEEAAGRDTPTAPLAQLAQRGARRAAALGRADGFPSSALLLRLEGLAVLAVAALGLASFTRRLLLPWTGSVHASAAGWAAALVFLVHPLATAAVAGVAARGELVAVALAVWSGTFFLRGRQDRRIGFTVASFVLCGLGGFASNVTLGLPVLFACAEFVSAHRYRTVRGRLRTTTTTLVVFGIAASVELVLHVSRHGPSTFPPLVRALVGLDGPGALATESRRVLAELGLLVLPVNADALGPAAFVLAGAIFLLSVQPAMVAARSAPRLWSLLLLFFVVGLALSIALHAGLPARVGSTPVLLSSAAVVAAGVGVASTALSGTRRRLLPWGVALGYAILAHGNALGWRAAGHATDRLARDLREATEVFGFGPTYLVVDPPRASLGVEPLDADPGWLVAPRLVDGRAARPRVRALSGAALRLLVGTPELRAWRADGLVLLLPGGPDGRTAQLLEPASPSRGARTWKNELSAGGLDVDPGSTRAMRVRARAGADRALLERVGWTSHAGDAYAADLGVWVEDDDGPLGVYDLAASPRWLASDRVRALRFEEGTLPLASVELEDALPAAGDVTVRVDGDAWRFAPLDSELARIDVQDASWVLALLDLATLESVLLPAESATGELVVPRAEPHARGLGPGPTLWSLERRVDGRAFVQSTGRVARDAAR